MRNAPAVSTGRVDVGTVWGLPVPPIHIRGFSLTRSNKGGHDHNERTTGGEAAQGSVLAALEPVWIRFRLTNPTGRRALAIGERAGFLPHANAVCSS